MEQNNSIMTSNEVAAYLKISGRHLFRLRSEGKIRYYQDKRLVRFRKEDVDEYIRGIEMPPFSIPKRGGGHD